MLRIGICAPYDLARDGGVNSHIRAQARALEALGHSVRVFGAASAAVASEESAISGCVSLVIDGTETGIGIDPRAWFRVSRLIDRERFDLLHIHEPLMPLVPWCAVLRARVPIVGTFHTYREDGHHFYPRARRVLMPLMRRLAARIAVSGAARQTVQRYFPGDYAVIPNGIDTARFVEPVARPPALRAGDRHVLYVGRLEPRKGVEHLIDAMSQVAQAGVAARLVVAGDGPARGALEARARGAQVDSYFAGRVPEADLGALYQHADVVCSPAVGGESFGIVLLEAMAAGRPVVAADIDGYRELLGTASGARLVPPADADALARELVGVLRDARRRDELGAAGRRFAAAFDWSVVARRLEPIYFAALRSSRPGSHTRSCSTR